MKMSTYWTQKNNRIYYQNNILTFHNDPMTRPQHLHTQIFLDSGDPEATKIYIEKLGFLDGQTTNPSLVAKKLKAENEHIALNTDELNNAYKHIIQQISPLVPESVSIEVYGDKDTPAEQMIAQGREMNTWVPNAHIKLPTTTEGLKAAETLTKEGIRVNMTLVFSQEQAAAVHAATKGAPKGSVYLSPFIGRLDDIGQNGMSLIKNIANMYKDADSHVEILAASLRKFDHFLGCIASGADILTCPTTTLDAWIENNMQLPDAAYIYDAGDLTDITYQDLDLNKPYSEYNIQHDLTDTGLQKFADDWNALINA